MHTPRIVVNAFFAVTIAAAGGPRLLAAQEGQPIPLKIVSGDAGSGRIYIPCSIDGNESSCLLDTLSVYSSVANSAPFNDSNKYPVINRIPHGGVAGAGYAQWASVIKLKSLKVGSIEARNKSMAVQGKDSVVGMDFLGGRAFSIRFGPQSVLTIGAEAPGRVESGLEIYGSNVFRFPVTIGGDRVKSLWDTGSGLTIVDVGYVAGHPDAFQLKGSVGACDPTGHTTPMKLYTAKHIQIGDMTFSDVTVGALDLGPLTQTFDSDDSMIIGYDLISRADWFFDPKGHVFAVSAAEGSPQTVAPAEPATCK